jgi:tRNA(Leu) C34 or U34 (ribose-2'-O)-methylase TrmL
MFSCVGLYNPKFDVNVGSALRAAYCYSVSMVAITGKRCSVRNRADTPKTYLQIPILRVDDLHSVVPFNCVPIAVDLIEGAIPLQDYVHPKNAFYIFGPEDSTLGKNILSWCRDTIYIPTRICMNLAATVNVVLYDRMSKSEKYK